MYKIFLKQLVISQFVLMSAVASAQTFTFTNVTNNTLDIGSQLSVDINDAGGSVLFDFSNDVGIASNIAEIYFDAGGFLASLGILSQSTGVTYAPGIAPPALAPQNPPGVADFTTNFGFDIGTGAGLNQSADSLILTGVLSGLFTYNDLLNAINSNDFEIALHVRSIDGEDSDSYILGGGPNAVPLPAAGWLFGSALLGLISLRRRM